VFAALDLVRFGEWFIAWVEELRDNDPDIVAIDGHSGSRDKRKARNPLHLVSAWATRQRIVLGQQARRPTRQRRSRCC
jgi:hypothetical protein